MSFTNETVTVISEGRVKAQAVVVFSSLRKIRVNMQGVPMDFRNDTKGNWTTKLSGLSFRLMI